MKQLYAYDFDKTLIPYDSFRRYLWHLIRYRPFTICFLLLLRKLRIISSLEIKKSVTEIVAASCVLQHDAKLFAQSIKKDICWQNKHDEATTLIITASPMIYMKYIVEDMSCEILCSDYIGGSYVEMYGDIKEKYLHAYYPTSMYQYAYAISDSESDLCWMQKFNEYKMINKKQ